MAVTDPVDLNALRAKVRLWRESRLWSVWFPPAEAVALLDDLEDTRQRLADTTTLAKEAIEWLGAGDFPHRMWPILRKRLLALAAVAPAPPTGPARRECGCLEGYPCGLGCALLVAAAPPTEPTGTRYDLARAFGWKVAPVASAPPTEPTGSAS